MAVAVPTVPIEHPQAHTRVQRVSTLRATLSLLPFLILAAIIGLVLYNPTTINLWHVGFAVVAQGLGIVQNVAWYYQPAYWGLAIIAVVLLTVAYFHWQVARNEWGYLLLFLVFVAVVNGLILSLGVVWFNETWLTWNWVHWQISPILCAGIYYTVKVPKMRTRYTSTLTGGGGAMDVYEVNEHRDHGQPQEQEPPHHAA